MKSPANLHPGAHCTLDGQARIEALKLPPHHLTAAPVANTPVAGARAVQARRNAAA